MQLQKRAKNEQKNFGTENIMITAGRGNPKSKIIRDFF